MRHWPFIVGLSCLIVAAGAYNARAGLKVSNPVVVDLGLNKMASGSLGSARNSGDGVQYIGCTSYGTSAACYASDASGNQGSCTTTNPAFVEAINSMAGDSWVAFHWNGPSCIGVTVRHYSYYAPKDL